MTTTISQTVLSPWLTPVRLVSTSNISGAYYNGPSNNGVGATLTISASSLTIDGVVCAVGDRVLLQTQTNTYEQGIYVVSSIGATVVLTRSEDMQDIEQMKSGLYASVGAGSVSAGNFYTLVEPLPSRIGIDAITFNADPAAGAVSFSGGPSSANALAVFSDTAGNIKSASTTTTLGQALNITGALGITGAITASTSLTATAGPVTSGSSGNSGSFISYPATAANGTFIFEALNAGGAFDTTIRNSAMGQSSVISVPDPGAATASFLLSSVASGQTVAASSASATPGTLRAMTGAFTESNATMTSGNIVGVRGSVALVSASGGFVYGLQGKVTPSGTLSGSVWAPAVFGQYDLSAATINAGQTAPVWADYGASGGTFTNVTGMRMFSGTNTIASLTLNAMDYRYGKASALFELSGDAGTYITAGAATPSGSMKKIRCTIDGVEHFLLAAAVWS